MLRFGLIGAGGIGRLHLKWAARHPDLVIAAICDADEARAQSFAQPFGGAFYSDYRRMLQTEVLDCVSIAVPHGMLAEIALACINSGNHVMVEKPMARHVAEGHRLLAAAKAKDVKLGCVYQYRSFDAPRAIKSVIESGKIGEIRHIIWNWHELRPQSYFDRANWRGSWQGAGSGLLTNQLSHDIDLLRFFAGEVISVQADLANHARHTPMEDAVSASMRLANGGLISLSASINHSTRGNYRAILGTRGMLVVPHARSIAGNPDDVIRLGTYRHHVEKAVQTYAQDHRQSDIRWEGIRSRPPSRPNWLPDFAKPALRAVADRISPGRGQWREGSKPTSGHGLALWQFVEAIGSDRPLPAGLDASNALQTLEVINALIMAGIEHRRIELPIDPTRYEGLFNRLVAGEAGLRHS